MKLTMLKGSLELRWAASDTQRTSLSESVTTSNTCYIKGISSSVNIKILIDALLSHSLLKISLK